MSLDLGPVGLWVSSQLLGSGAGSGVDVARVARELEELGVPALWVGAASGDLGMVSSLLAASRRLVVATGIVNIWTVPAPELAASVARVNARYPGRFLLGLGVSHASSVEASGQRYVAPYRKMVAYLGELDLSSPPVPRRDRVLAALGPRMLRLSAEAAGGAHPYLVTPEHTRRARKILGPGPLLAPEQMVVLEAGAGAAREIARATLARYLQLPNYTSNLLRLGFGEEDFGGGGSDRLVDALVVRGRPEDVEARVREHHAAGADHVAVQVLRLPDAPGLPYEQWRSLASLFA